MIAGQELPIMQNSGIYSYRGGYMCYNRCHLQCGRTLKDTCCHALEMLRRTVPLFIPIALWKGMIIALKLKIVMHRLNLAWRTIQGRAINLYGIQTSRSYISWHVTWQCYLIMHINFLGHKTSSSTILYDTILP